jgi:hypothetical protein
MKIARKGSPMISGGTNSAPKKFQIQASGAAFAVLSSKLYNNKPLAIVRELSCNAYDAHIAAGKAEVPFDLHLPTSFEPWFAIRDYGIGLAPEEIETLYCTYFSSTKNNDNTMIGAMGLGSKSPFCYTDGFTVTTFWNGKKYIYSAYIENDGTPSVKRLSSHKTDEVNGLEVQFPVKSQDCWEFENMARVALEFFNPLPNINVKGFEVRQQNYSIKTDRWGMRALAPTHHTSGIRAIMGVVQYSVGNLDISRLSSEQRKLSEKPLDIFFPIGSLSVAASREMLSNDETTIDAILTELTTIYSRMMEEIVERIENCKTEWEARLLIFSMLADGSTQGVVQSAINEGKIYKKYSNFTLEKDLPFINELDYHHTMLSVFSKSGGTKWATKHNLFTKRAPDVRERIEVEALQNTSILTKYDIEFSVQPTVAFVVNDIKFGGEKYLHQFIQGDDGGVNRFKKVYLFSRYDKNSSHEDMMKEFEAIYLKMCGVPIIKMSELKAKYPELDERMPGQATGPRRGLLVMSGNGRSQYGKGWSRTWKKIFSSELPSGEKYFVWVENFTTLCPVAEIPFYNGSAFVDYISVVRGSKAFGLTQHTPVYGIKKGTKLPKMGDGQWTELIPQILKRIPIVMTAEKQMKLSHRVKLFNNDFEDFLDYANKKNTLDLNSPMFQFVTLWNKQDGSDEGEYLWEVVSVAKQAGKFKVEHAIDFSALWNEMVNTHYPILTLSFNSYYSHNSRMSEKLLEYVKNMDEHENNSNIRITTVEETVQS